MSDASHTDDLLPQSGSESAQPDLPTNESPADAPSPDMIAESVAADDGMPIAHDTPGEADAPEGALEPAVDPDAQANDVADDDGMHAAAVETGDDNLPEVVIEDSSAPDGLAMAAAADDGTHTTDDDPDALDDIEVTVEDSAMPVPVIAEPEPAARAAYPVPDIQLRKPAPAAPTPPTHEPLLVDGVPFEDLSIAAALGHLWKAPRATAGAFIDVMSTPKERALKPSGRRTTRPRATGAPSDYVPQHVTRHADAEEITSVISEPEFQVRGMPALVLLMLRLGAFALVLIGGIIMVSGNPRSSPEGLAAGILPTLLGLFASFIVEILNAYVSGRGQGRFMQRVNATPEAAPRQMDWIDVAQRAVLLVAAAATAAISVVANRQNTFTMGGVIAWVASILLVIWALSPVGWSPLSWLKALGSTRIRFTWAGILVIIFMIVGTVFRMQEFRAAPSEMTSDHVEMLLDTLNVTYGDYDVFFASNGGREAMQFYLLAWFGSLTGMGVTFDANKLLTVIQGILTIPLMYFAAREIIGREQRRLAEIAGVAAAAMLAVSMWHLNLSRLGERLILMPLFMTLFLLFFARAMRYNRRMDYIYTALAVGAGLWSYQAFRMVPLVLIISSAVCLAHYLRRGPELRRVFINLVVLALVLTIVFLPLFAFSLEYPDDFWRRTSGRIFGDGVTETVNEEGIAVYREATFEEQIASFNQNIPQLVTNIQNALLSFNWRGDVAWFQNAPSEPAFDPLTGALLLLGAGAWFGRMLRRRDPMTWLLPGILLIMLLPSALSIAYPVENPSSTRLSGTLPITYVVAGFGAALLITDIRRAVGRGMGALLAVVAGFIVIGYSYSNNTWRYLTLYGTSYDISSLPYSDAARTMKEFAENSGGWGNIFIINYPYWWDHRALALTVEMPDFPNGVGALNELPVYMSRGLGRDEPYRLDPDRPILFFFSKDDDITRDFLQMSFPSGSSAEMSTYQAEDSYRIFSTPPIGREALMQFLQVSLETPGG